MGYIVHEAVLVTYPHTDEFEDLSHKILEFVNDLTPSQGNLFVGPVIGKGIVTWVMTPDGAPEGKPKSDEADVIREEFLGLVIPVEDVSIVHLSYGGTEKETQIIFSTDDIEEGNEVVFEPDFDLDPGTDPANQEEE
jgi:hypothetical protein